MEDHTNDIFAANGKVDRIVIFQNLLFPKHKDEIDSKFTDEEILEKIGFLLDAHYEEFVDFCEYLSDNENKNIAVSGYIVDNDEVSFSVYDGKGTSNLSFKHIMEEVS